MQRLFMMFGLLIGAWSVAFALPNPASVNCVKKGGKSVIIKNTGLCVFADDTFCEEWAFFKKKCKKGETKLPEKLSQNNAKQYCSENIDNKLELIKCRVAM